MKRIILFLQLFYSLHISYGQSEGGKTFDKDSVEFHNLPALTWESEEYINNRPKFSGFLLVKGKLNGIYDISGGLYEENEFHVGKINVWDDNDIQRFSMDLRQTQFRLRSQRETEYGTVVGYLEGDFQQGENGYKLRHVWIDFRFLHIGQDWSFFGDKDIWPNIFEWNGPPSGIWKRIPQIKFTLEPVEHVSFEFGIEQTDAQIGINSAIDSTINKSQQRFPETIGAVKWSDKFGHVRLSGILRNLDYQLSDSKKTIQGYGLSLSVRVFTEKLKMNSIQFQLIGGSGITAYQIAFDGLNYDALPKGAGVLETVPSMGSWISYEHYLTIKWHVNGTVGYSRLQASDIQEYTIDPISHVVKDGSISLIYEYIVVNLMYDPIPGLTFGVEYNHGKKIEEHIGDFGNGEVNNIDKSRDASRISFGAFFDF